MSITFTKLIEKLNNNTCDNVELNTFVLRKDFISNPSHKKDICVALAKNESLSSLRIECAFEDKDFLPLAEAIKQNRNLTSITLGHMNNRRLTVMSDALILNTSLREINLRLDFIGFEGAKALGNIIMQNPRISNIHLDFNEKIEDHVALALSKSISQNINFRIIDFYFHTISIKYFKSITSALAGHKTLTNLKLGWRILGKENEQYNKEFLENFSLGNIQNIVSMTKESDETNPEGAKAIAELILINKNITKLELGRHFDVESLKIISTALIENETLKEISFPSYKGNYDNEKMIKEIQQILRNNANRKHRTAFTMGFHPKYGKESSVYSLKTNELYAPDLVKIIFSMLDCNVQDDSSKDQNAKDSNESSKCTTQ